MNGLRQFYHPGDNFIEIPIIYAQPCAGTRDAVPPDMKTTKLVKRWQVGYERNGARVISTRIYTYSKAHTIVARLRARGNDAYLAGALSVRIAVEIATLPATSGKWSPVYRGTNPLTRTLIAHQEVFPTCGGSVWVTIPGKSRFVEVAS